MLQKKGVGEPAAWKEQTECLFLDGGQSEEGSVEERALGVGPGKERVIMESPGISAKQGKRPGLQLTQEGQERASRGTGFWHLHLKLVLLSSYGDNPSDSVCAAGVGSGRSCSWELTVCVQTRREGLTYSMWEGGV